MTQVQSKGKAFKQWNGKCRGHAVIPRQVCVRSKEMANGSKLAKERMVGYEVREVTGPCHTGSEERLRTWVFPLRYREDRGF